MSLETTIKAIKEAKPFAEENIETGPMETMGGRRGRKIQAIEQLKMLKRQYRTDLLTSAVFIIVAGSARSDFEKVATEKFGLFSADPDEFYKDLANRVSPSLYLGKESVSNLFDVLGRHLEDKMNELDVNEYNQLIFKAEYVQNITSPEEFTTLAKRAINKQLGAEIVGVQAVTSILDKAIENEHSAKTTSIVLSTGDEALALSLVQDLERITSRIFLVVAGKGSKTLKGVQESISVKDATEDTVKSTLDTIKSALKR